MLGAVSEVLCIGIGAMQSRLFPESTWGVSPCLCTEGTLGLGIPALELEEQDLCGHSS